MKKKIGFVPMDPVLGAWLLEMLAKEPPESDNAAELCAGMQDLLRGEVTSLLLSASGEGEAPAPAESLQLGELEIFPKSRRVLMQIKTLMRMPAGCPVSCRSSPMRNPSTMERATLKTKSM